MLGTACTSSAGTSEGDLCLGMVWHASRSKQTGPGQQIQERFCWGPAWTKWCYSSLYSISYPFLSSPTAGFLWPIYEMKLNDQALEKDVLHRSHLESKELCQHNTGRCFLWGKEGEKKGTCEWAGGEQARTSNTSCGTYHDYNLLCKRSSALPVKCPRAWMARWM